MLAFITGMGIAYVTQEFVPFMYQYPVIAAAVAGYAFGVFKYYVEIKSRT